MIQHQRIQGSSFHQTSQALNLPKQELREKEDQLAAQWKDLIDRWYLNWHSCVYTCLGSYGCSMLLIVLKYRTLYYRCTWFWCETFSLWAYCSGWAVRRRATLIHSCWPSTVPLFLVAGWRVMPRELTSECWFQPICLCLARDKAGGISIISSSCWQFVIICQEMSRRCTAMIDEYTSVSRCWVAVQHCATILLKSQKSTTLQRSNLAPNDKWQWAYRPLRALWPYTKLFHVISQSAQGQ